MKVAILSESDADEAVVRVLVEGILSQTTQAVEPLPLRSRGWPAVRDVLHGVLHHLQYRTDAEALVVVADSNHSPVHQADHSVDDPDIRCRFCELKRAASNTLRGLRPEGSRQLIRVAIGLAVPSLEAWLRCGRDPTVSETSWIDGLQARREPYTKNALKQRLYGTDRPNRELLKRCGTEEAGRLSQDLALLESRLPAGFGSLAAEIRSWTTTRSRSCRTSSLVSAIGPCVVWRPVFPGGRIIAERAVCGKRRPTGARRTRVQRH